MELSRKYSGGRGLSIKFSCRKMLSNNVYLFVPNIIGYIRLALLVVAFSYAQQNHVLVVTCYLLSAFLDEFDGYAARRLGQTSIYGQQLDEITDEVATMGMAIVCCYLYPQYIWFFQILTAVDVAGHWAHMHNSVLEGNDSHKSGKMNPILRVYWTNKILASFWVYGNHVFLAMTYLCYFTQGPSMSLFGYSVGMFKLIQYMSAPWSISRGFINGLMMIEGFRKFAKIDMAKRATNLEEQNGYSIQNGHLTTIGNTLDGHDHQN